MPHMRALMYSLHLKYVDMPDVYRQDPRFVNSGFPISSMHQDSGWDIIGNAIDAGNIDFVMMIYEKALVAKQPYQPRLSAIHSQSFITKEMAGEHIMYAWSMRRYNIAEKLLRVYRDEVDIVIPEKEILNYIGNTTDVADVLRWAGHTFGNASKDKPNPAAPMRKRRRFSLFIALLQPAFGLVN